jgi:acetyl esterase/lipase
MDLNIVKASNISYGHFDRHQLDIYYPKTNKQDLPVVICIHGGMWCYSDKTAATEMSINIALRGYVVVTPSYRLSNMRKIVPDLLPTLAGVSLITTGCSVLFEKLQYLITLIVIWITVLVIDIVSRQKQSILHPSHIDDLHNVWTWVQSNISKYHGSPKMCFLLGHSAGGHLASLLATHLGKHVCPGVVSISGVYSNVLLQKLWLGNMILNNVFGDDMAAFPIYHITEDTPPHFLINAEYDFSLKRHSHLYEQLLMSKQVYTQYYTYPCTNHFSIRKYWDFENRHILDDICGFLQSCQIRNTN